MEWFDTGDLSWRASAFLADNCFHRSSLYLGSGDRSDHAEGWVAAFEEMFGGIVLPVLGGELQGWMRLGARSGRTHVTPLGELVFNCAQPQFVQCGFLCRSDGWFGVSWTGEFLPWHITIGQLIESAAIWQSLRGWTVWSLTGHDVEVDVDMAGVSPEPAASCDVTQWWIGADVAVYSEPYLTYSDRRTHVIAKNVGVLTAVRERIWPGRQTESRHLAVVGMGFPAPPTDLLAP